MSVGEAVSRFPRERTWLLPALQSAQRAEGWLSPETLAAVAAHLRVPRSEVWGVASHYPELRLAKPGRRVVRVCTGVACVARGRGPAHGLAARRRRRHMRPRRGRRRNAGGAARRGPAARPGLDRRGGRL